MTATGRPVIESLSRSRDIGEALRFPKDTDAEKFLATLKKQQDKLNKSSGLANRLANYVPATIQVVWHKTAE
jgi:hypothetical protein